MSKTPRHVPVGKLVPLPVPCRPWSHIGVDFVSDLPTSNGNTCILVLVNHFSKACKFIPLKGLPTALETAKCLFTQVFQNYCLPEEVVSDPVNFPSLEGLILITGSDCELVLGVPPLGRECTKLPPPEYHRSDPLPLHTQLPAPTLPMDGRAL